MWQPHMSTRCRYWGNIELTVHVGCINLMILIWYELGCGFGYKPEYE